MRCAVTNVVRCSLNSLFLVLTVLATSARSEDNNRFNRPDYQQAAQYSSEYLRQFMYDTAVTPRWIGKTDQFWYSYRTSRGTSYYRVNPRLGTKVPLFDRVRLASQLMELVQKPLEPVLLTLNRPSVNDEGTKLKFVFDEFQYEYDLVAEKLVKLGKAPPLPTLTPPNGITSREELERWRDEQLRRQDEQRRDQDQDQDRNNQQQDNQQNSQQENVQQQDNQQTNQERSSSATATSSQRGRPDHRNYSPDRKAYVFAKGHNLFYVELKDEKKDDSKKGDAKKEEPKNEEVKTGSTNEDEAKKEEAKKEDSKTSEAQKLDPAPQDKAEDAKQNDSKQTEAKKSDESNAKATASETKPTAPSAAVDHDGEAIQLTTDGAEDYSFASRFGFGTSTTRGTSGTSSEPPPITPDRKTRPNVTWSKDSKAFHISRSDSRGVQDLWVINSLTAPRPTIEKYKYAMPGEEKVRKSELFVFHREAKKLVRVTPKWKDESYSNFQWGKTGSELYVLRRDRLLRHVEFCSLSTTTGEAKCLIAEGFENAYLVSPSIRYVEETDELVWWSERSGWGHFYLYDRDGKLKNSITSGAYRASRIVDVDAKNRTLYFVGNAREPEENIYFEHLYSVHFDG